MQKCRGGNVGFLFQACCPNDEHHATLRWCKRANKCCKPPKAHEGWVARESLGRNCVALLRLFWMREGRWFTRSLFGCKLLDFFAESFQRKGYCTHLPSRCSRSCSHLQLTGMQQALLTLSIWSLKQPSEWAKSSSPRLAKLFYFICEVETEQRPRS